MFKINIHNLKEGEHRYEFTADALDFGIEPEEAEVVDKIYITAVLYKVGTQISVKIELQGKFKFQCDRCTEDYIYDFKTEFNIIYKYQFKGMDTDEKNDDDEIKFIAPNTIFIDLKEDIRDFIILSIPLKKAPEEKDGICLYCKKSISESFVSSGKEEVNPVWEKLIKVKNKIK